MTADQCNPLPVCATSMQDGTPVLISCWKVTAEELREIERTGRVWVLVAGHSMPPISPTGHCPFDDCQRPRTSEDL
jgi:hypothetical protein